MNIPVDGMNKYISKICILDFDMRDKVVLQDKTGLWLRWALLGTGVMWAVLVIIIGIPDYSEISQSIVFLPSFGLFNFAFVTKEILIFENHVESYVKYFGIKVLRTNMLYTQIQSITKSESNDSGGPDYVILYQKESKIKRFHIAGFNALRNLDAIIKQIIDRSGRQIEMK